MNVLLDTCALIWLVNGDTALSRPALEAIQGAWAAHVSAVTAWELGIKHSKNKIELGEALERWFERVIEQHSLCDFPLDSRSAIRASRLPALHADPADRLLIATAIEHGMTLLTPDPIIRKYPGLQTIW
jgi:PIN domain nuclease of toxin-antitoxin system